MPEPGHNVPDIVRGGGKVVVGQVQAAKKDGVVSDTHWVDQALLQTVL